LSLPETSSSPSQPQHDTCNNALHALWLEFASHRLAPNGVAAIRALSHTQFFI
jgi:hypothetical protein